MLNLTYKTATFALAAIMVLQSNVTVGVNQASADSISTGAIRSVQTVQMKKIKSFIVKNRLTGQPSGDIDHVGRVTVVFSNNTRITVERNGQVSFSRIAKGHKRGTTVCAKGGSTCGISFSSTWPGGGQDTGVEGPG